MLPGGGDDPLDLGGRPAEGLFAQHVPPGLQGPHGDLRQAVVRGRDDDQVDAAAGYEGPPVAVAADPVLGGQTAGRLLIDVADGDQAAPVVGGHRLGPAAAGAAGPDHGDPVGHGFSRRTAPPSPAITASTSRCSQSSHTADSSRPLRPAERGETR